MLHIEPGQLRRWAFGYERGGRFYNAAINADLDELGGDRALTFLDLVELMFIQGLRASGHSFPKVHEAHRVLSRLLESEHPFALNQGEDSVEELAWLYDLEAAQVVAAVEYENSPLFARPILKSLPPTEGRVARSGRSW